jgi:hypothetical protein
MSYIKLFVLLVIVAVLAIPSFAQDSTPFVPTTNANWNFRECEEKNDSRMAFITPGWLIEVTEGDPNGLRTEPLQYRENFVQGNEQIFNGTPLIVLSEPFCSQSLTDESEQTFVWVHIAVLGTDITGFTPVRDTRAQNSELWLEMASAYETATQTATTVTETATPATNTTPQANTCTTHLVAGEAVLIGMPGEWTPASDDVDGHNQHLRITPSVAMEYDNGSGFVPNHVYPNTLTVGTSVTVLSDAPVCAEGHTWVHVSHGTETGWLSSFDSTAGEARMMNINQ